MALAAPSRRTLEGGCPPSPLPPGVFINWLGSSRVGYSIPPPPLQPLQGAHSRPRHAHAARSTYRSPGNMTRPIPFPSLASPCALRARALRCPPRPLPRADGDLFSSARRSRVTTTNDGGRRVACPMSSCEHPTALRPELASLTRPLSLGSNAAGDSVDARPGGFGLRLQQLHAWQRTAQRYARADRRPAHSALRAAL